MGTITRLAGALALASLAAAPAGAVDIRDLTSPGGVDYWLVEEPSIPIIAVEIGFRGGAARDQAGRAGLARMVAGLMDEGAGTRDAAAFAEARDKLAARFSFGAERDRVTISARMLAETAGQSIALLAEAMQAPRFDPEAIERVRGQMLSRLAEAETDPSDRARRAWFARAFADHPYGTPADGTAESVAAITRDDLVAQHKKLLTRANAKIAIVGAVDTTTAGRIVDTLMDGLPEGRAFRVAKVESAPPPGTEVIALPVPQSVAVFGHEGLYRDDPDFFPAYVMNHILGGGGFSSRLTEEVREKRGLAYSVYSYLSVLDGAALYMGGVQTANARIAQSLEVIRAEIARMAAGKVTEADLEEAKRYLTGAFPLRFDSNAKIARYLVFMQEEDLGRDYIDRRNGLIEVVTLADIRQVAMRLLEPEALSVVVAGQPAGL